MNTIQKNLYQLLCEIDELCKSQDIQYFLAGGTALGVVRNHRFLPWDDDMDLYITRDNWAKLRDVVESGKVELPPNRELVYAENTPYYSNPIPRYVDTSTTAIYSSQMLPGRACGQHVEFLIMDPMPNEEQEKAEFLKNLRMYTELISPYFVVNKSLSIEDFREHAKEYKKVYAVAEKEGLDAVLKDLDVKLHSCVEFESKEMCMRWGIQTLIYQHADFGKSRPELFEGRMFPVGEHAEGILRDAYGDSWMYVPEVEDQVIHNALQDIEIPYEEYTKRYLPYVDKEKMLQSYRKNKNNSLSVFCLRREREKLAVEAQALIIRDTIKNELEEKLDDIRDSYNAKAYGAVRKIYRDYTQNQMNQYARKYNVYYNISDECMYYILMTTIQQGRYFEAQKYLNIRKQNEPLSEKLAEVQELVDYCRELSIAIYDFDDVDYIKELLRETKPEWKELLDYGRAELWLNDRLAESELDWQQQKTRAERWNRTYPEDGEVMAYLAESELKLGEKEKAEQLYNRAIHLTRNGIIWEKAKESVGLERIEEEYDLRK